jgi:signal peptidase I
MKKGIGVLQGTVRQQAQRGPDGLLDAVIELPLSGADLVDLIRPLLQRGISCRFRAKGSSMWPFIREGDIITVAPLEKQPPELGEVFAFEHPANGRLTVHRVVSTRNQALLFKGDNTRQPDGSVPTEKLVGRVTRVEREGQNVSVCLGAERRTIAVLSRRPSIIPILAHLWRIIRGALRPMNLVV